MLVRIRMPDYPLGEYMMKTRSLLILFFLILLGQPVFAKRGPVPEVKSVFYIDKEIRVANDSRPGNLGFIHVYVKGTNKLIFSKQIYFIVYNFMLERDAQDIYIKTLEVKGDTIIIENELGYTYSFNMNTYDLEAIKGSVAIKGSQSQIK
jgi:hypothetical protein